MYRRFRLASSGDDCLKRNRKLFPLSKQVHVALKQAQSGSSAVIHAKPRFPVPFLLVFRRTASFLSGTLPPFFPALVLLTFRHIPSFFPAPVLFAFRHISFFLTPALLAFRHNYSFFPAPVLLAFRRISSFLSGSLPPCFPEGRKESLDRSVA